MDNYSACRRAAPTIRVALLFHSVLILVYVEVGRSHKDITAENGIKAGDGYDDVIIGRSY